MKSSFGTLFCVQLFGESHGIGIGCVVEGCPAGLVLKENDIQRFLDLRKPGQALTTPRKEEDNVEILSGVFRGKTTGAPLAMFIHNQDVDSSYYEEIKDTPRPGHADYPVHEKYGGFNDYRGGGHLSGRLTAAMVCAGAVAKKLLQTQGIEVLAQVKQLGGVLAEPTDEQIRKNVYRSPVRCADPAKEKAMVQAIEKAKDEGDSLGAVIEGRVLGLPAGVGEPLFDSVESLLSAALFAIPAVKGVEFGSGFLAARMKGSEHNDEYVIEQGQIKTKTNFAGGILGGITNGMPVVFRVAFKPTSSIQKTQHTVNLKEQKESELRVRGRHDPCVALRAVPVVEGMAACVFADLIIRAQRIPRVLK